MALRDCSAYGAEFGAKDKSGEHWDREMRNPLSPQPTRSLPCHLQVPRQDATYSLLCLSASVWAWRFVASMMPLWNSFERLVEPSITLRFRDVLVVLFYECWLVIPPCILCQRVSDRYLFFVRMFALLGSFYCLRCKSTYTVQEISPCITRVAPLSQDDIKKNTLFW